MKKYIILLLLTLTIPLISYLMQENYLPNFSLSLYFLVLFVILKTYKILPKFNINISFVFIRYLAYGVLLLILPKLLFSVNMSFRFPELEFQDIIYFILIPFFEEFFFRFYVFWKLKNLSSYKIILFSSFLFAISHLAVHNLLLYTFFFGLLLSIYYYKSKNILMVYIIHLTINSVTLFFPITIPKHPKEDVKYVKIEFSEEITRQNYLFSPHDLLYIYNFENIFSESQAQQLYQKALKVKEEHKLSIIVVSDSIPWSTSFEESTMFTAGMFAKKYNLNKIVAIKINNSFNKIGIAYNHRDSGIIVNDSVCSNIINYTLNPNFKKGKYYEGVDMAIDSLMKYLE